MHRIYLHLWLLLLLTACSQEELVISGGGSASDDATTENVTPITIRFQPQAENKTRAVAEDDLYETMDEVRILVFSSKAPFSAGKNEFTYTPNCISSDAAGKVKTEIVVCAADTDKDIRTAKAYFIPTDKDKIYRIYAVAYNAARWGDGEATGVKLHVEDKKLYYADDLFADIAAQTPIYENIETSQFTYMEVLSVPAGETTRLEFFAGSVGRKYSKGSGEDAKNQFVHDIVDGSKKGALEGTLYRASGRLSFHLTDIDPNKYSKMRLVMEKYTNTSLFGLSNRWVEWKEYEAKVIDGYTGVRDAFPVFRDVFGVCWHNQATMVTADEAIVSNAGTVDLYVDCIATDQFKLYVEPLDKDNKSMGRFLIQCKDKAFYPGYIGIKDMIVENGLFTILGNYWGKLSGEFNNLSNIKIDETSWANWETYPTGTPLD